MRSLQNVLTSELDLDLTGWTLTTARAISNDGLKITGYGMHNGISEAWVAIIPEPSTLGLLLLGGVSILHCRSRKR